ncbi:MAG: carboxymuconolactone decarboxylase family protein [Actinomycetota bacterium]|nr:carboxymuconolactone decarboxylase family protein [Actinomycetota bacterium]
MEEHLPRVYLDFNEDFPHIAEAHGELARRIRESTPFDERTDRLIKLALAIGAEADGAVRSNVRKGLQHGITPEEMRYVALSAITTCGFPTAIAGLRWTQMVFDGEEVESDREP